MHEPRRGKDFSQELAEKGWYHSFELPDGTRIEGFNQIDTLRKRYARFPIPVDLTGSRLVYQHVAGAVEARRPARDMDTVRVRLRLNVLGDHADDRGLVVD